MLKCQQFFGIFSSPEPKAHRLAYRIGRGPLASTSASTISKENISEASGPILIKFDVNHHWVGGLIALGFGADCIKIVVSIATDSSHRLTMGKTKKIFFSDKGVTPITHTTHVRNVKRDMNIPYKKIS